MRSRIGVALLAVLGLGVIAVGCGGDGKECGEGTVAMGDTCVPESTIECGEGTVLDMEVCVPEEEPVTCGAGTTLNSATGMCEPDVTCATGTIAMGGECVPDGSVICTGNTVYDAETGTCVLDPEACAEGTVLVEGECVAYDDSLVADVHAAAEPDDSTYEGTGATFTPPAVGSTVTLDGCITPQDFDEDGVIDADNDVFDFTVTAPGLYDMRIDGLNGLSAAFVVISADDTLGDWQRIAVDLTNDSAQRRIWLPRAGQYGIVVTDGRSLLTGEPAGSEDTCYFMSIEALAAPTPTALTADTRTGNLGGDPQFFSIAASGETVFRVQLDADSSVAAPAIVLAQGETFEAQAGDSPSAAAFSNVVPDAGALTIVVDNIYNYSLNPVPYELAINRTVEADGTVSIPHQDELFTFLWFEGTAGEIVRFAHTSADPIVLQLINSDVTAFLANVCPIGDECDSSESWLQLATTGRYLVRVYNEAGTDGTPYDVTFERETYTPTALTSGAASTLTINDGFAFATIDTSALEWARIDLANLTGTAFTEADVTIFARDAEGSLRLPGTTGGLVTALDGGTTDESLSRIWIPTSGEILIAVNDGTAFEGDETVDLTVGPEDYEAITLTIGTPVTRDDVVIAAEGRALYLLRADAGSQITVTATGNGGADAVIGLLDNEASAVDQVDDTGADEAETLEATMPSDGWIAIAIDAGLPGGTVDVSFDAAPPPYSVMDSPRTFADACATGTEIVMGDDTLSPVQTLTSFTSFEFFGDVVTGFRASTNGWLTFDTAYTGSSFVTIPATGTPNSVVAPLARDLVGRVCVLESASELIVQWSGQTYGTGGTPVEMQAVFLAGSNEIHFVYGPGHQTAARAFDEVGIENATGTYSLEAPSRVMASAAFRFVPTP